MLRSLECNARSQPRMPCVQGDTRVALYGLGNIRDERLGRLFQTPGCVRWLLPEASEAAERDMWLNLFVLHQNRVQHTAAGKSCVQEPHLPNFLDLVIWGHEHECRCVRACVRADGWLGPTLHGSCMDAPRTHVRLMCAYALNLVPVQCLLQG